MEGMKIMGRSGGLMRGGELDKAGVKDRNSEHEKEYENWRRLW